MKNWKSLKGRTGLLASMLMLDSFEYVWRRAWG